MKTAVLGSGSWGTALAQVLCDNGQDVIIWGINPDEVNDINRNHHNAKYFECEITPKLKASNDLSCIRDADILLLAVPTKAMESVLDSAVKELDHPVTVINVAKGFHPVSHKRLSVVIQETMEAFWTPRILPPKFSLFT